MTRFGALEKTIAEVTSLEKFLNDYDRENAANIVDPGFIGEPLNRLGLACGEALVWLQKELKEEEEKNLVTHEEKKRELCIKDSDF